MNNETERKFKSELRSFFGLIMMNLVTAALAMGLGIALSITMLMEMVQSGDILLPSLILVPLGATAAAFGIYWITQTAELMDGVTDIRKAYGDLPKGDVKDEAITAMMIKMTALYRANQPLIGKMKVLGMAGGAALIALGAFQIINQLWSIATVGFVIDDIDRLISGSISIAVGAAGLLTAHYFSTYSRVWDARMAEAAKIEDVLREKLEGI